MRLRKYKPGAIAHVYQRSFNGHILFYSKKDCLLFFTIFCEAAKRHGIRIIALCLMPDHIHFLAMAESQSMIATFVDVYSTLYAREFNSAVGRKGHVFRTPYGLANKRNEKAQRTAILYVFNNPVEKKLTKRMESWRWNFFEYGITPEAFSDHLKLSIASKRLRQRARMVKAQHARGNHLNLAMLDRLFDGLSAEECEQLTDLIIGVYNVVDYQCLDSLFGSLDNLRTAAATTTGSEYDLQEVITPSSDKAYAKMGKYVADHFSLSNPREVVNLEPDKKVRLANELFSSGLGTSLQVRKYLHIDNSD